MPLPCPAFSASISISQIRSELGTSSGSLRTLSSLAGKGTPDAMSEFYCYSPAPPYVINLSRPVTPGSGSSSGSIVINSAPQTLTLSAFGGGGSGNSTTGGINIIGVGSFTTSQATQYQTRTTSITFNSTGTFSVTSLYGIFSGNSGNQVNIY